MHAVNSDKAIGLNIFLLDWQPHGVECQSLCGSEVTKKINSWKSRGHMPQCPQSWQRQCYESIHRHQLCGCRMAQAPYIWSLGLIQSWAPNNSRAKLSIFRTFFVQECISLHHKKTAAAQALLQTPLGELMMLPRASNRLGRGRSPPRPCPLGIQSGRAPLIFFCKSAHISQ